MYQRLLAMPTRLGCGPKLYVKFWRMKSLQLGWLTQTTTTPRDYPLIVVLSPDVVVFSLIVE